jgi:hypothetical protein
MALFAGTLIFQNHKIYFLKKIFSLSLNIDRKFAGTAGTTSFLCI